MITIKIKYIYFYIKNLIVLYAKDNRHQNKLKQHYQHVHNNYLTEPEFKKNLLEITKTDARCPMQSVYRWALFQSISCSVYAF